jgi:sulfonate transport system ATP-binding protein
MKAARANVRWLTPLGIDDPAAFVPAALYPEADRSHGKGLPIQFDHTAKSFGDRRVLAGLDFTIPAGQFVAIVGRSGGGKTTLLRLLTGLELPTQGRVLIDGKPVAGLQSSVRLLFQDARLLPWQRVISNVGIAREPGWRPAALAALDDVGLADRANDWLPSFRAVSASVSPWRAHSSIILVSCCWTSPSAPSMP